MGVLEEKNKKIDVICQHTKDGGIIPLRVRVQDEDGEYHDFTIKAYKEKNHPGQFISPYGTAIHGHTWIFICKIQVLDVVRNIELLYNANENIWRIVKMG